MAWRASLKTVGAAKIISRAPYAVNELLQQGIVDRYTLQQVADEFSVYPFELSLIWFGLT